MLFGGTTNKFRRFISSMNSQYSRQRVAFVLLKPLVLVWQVLRESPSAVRPLDKATRDISSPRSPRFVSETRAGQRGDFAYFGPKPIRAFPLLCPRPTCASSQSA